ncbi:MAG: sigma-54-dependent Fis family transcriptional regulator [Acidobacteria bacterium]|nr:sigma-54-dependent Fis family transcriptional regulator [Acidobacteriota bacterium]
MNAFTEFALVKSQSPQIDFSDESTGLFTLLAELSQILAGTDGFGNVSNRALELLKQNFGVVRAAVLLCDNNYSDEIQTVASFGWPLRKRKYLSGLQNSSRLSVIREVLKTGSEFISVTPHRTLTANGKLLSSSPPPKDTILVLCFPMRLEQDPPLGAFSLEVSCSDPQSKQNLLQLFRMVTLMLTQALTLNQLVEAATQRMLEDNSNLRAELSERYDFSHIIGNSGPMREVYEQIAQVACTNTTVLITGESGTGKELVAHALHINSPRASKPFIKVNCAALPEELIASELFGHERGAYTGAEKTKPGRFDLAEGGTLFLDEIGELKVNIQIQLLRVLQQREYERIGGIKTIKADVRIIVATNRDLEKEVAAGRFRADLYYRLNVFTISTPALRERPDDISALAEYFLKKHARAHRKAQLRLSTRALDYLKSYSWPGNVRELENVLERAVVVADGPLIQHYHLPPSLQTIEPVQSEKRGGLLEEVDTFERELILDALKNTRGKRTQAAKQLKISERLLTYKVKKYGIDCEMFRR